MAADRFSINKNFDAIQAKYVGTGHADMTKFEWGTNQHRDTCASLIGHHDRDDHEDSRTATMITATTSER